MRAFVAVDVGAEVAARLADLQAELPLVVRKVEPQNMHITLAFLGDMGQKKLELARAALEGIAAKPFEVKCVGVGAFPSEQMIRVVWAGAESNELRLLHSQVGYALEGAGFQKEDYSPHITIGRPSRGVELVDFLRRHAKDDFGTFRAESVKLKKSTLGPAGPVYEDVFVKKLD